MQNPLSFDSTSPRSAGMRLFGCAVVLFAMVTLSPWLLDGFNIGPINDGWVGLTLKLPPGHVLNPAQGLRLFGSLPRIFGLYLINDGFQGWQFILVVLTFLRGLLFFLIVRRLVPERPLFALICGLVGMFNPADRSYFWVDAANVHFALALALAACWCAVAYMEGGTYLWLLGSWAFQFLSGFTYTAFVPLLLVFPVCVWLLFRGANRAPSRLRLLAITSVALLIFCMHAVTVTHGVGREGRVADLSIPGVVSGYVAEAALCLRNTAHIFQGFRPLYLLFAILPALLAYGAARVAMRVPAPTIARPRHFITLFALGLAALSAVSYLPYALSDTRFGDTRQLLAAGTFFYSAVFFAILALVPGKRDSRLGSVIVAILAALTVVVALEKRQPFVDAYRVQESFLAQIVAVAPAPPAGTTLIVQLHRRQTPKDLIAFYTRWHLFRNALQAMYTDPTLQAGVVWTPGSAMRLDSSGITLLDNRNGEARVQAPYDHLLLLDSVPGGHVGVLDHTWLQQHVSPGANITGYVPKTGTQPGPDSAICTMLERDFRPAYCSR